MGCPLSGDSAAARLTASRSARPIGLSFRLGGTSAIQPPGHCPARTWPQERLAPAGSAVYLDDNEDSPPGARPTVDRKEERMESMRLSRRSRLRAALAGAAGLALGIMLGGSLLFGLAHEASGDANPLPSLDPARLIDATHVPPLITVPGESVTLRYDIYCPPPE